MADAGVFPLVLQVQGSNDLPPWKLSLDYDAQRSTFVLSINDEAFLELPCLAEVTPPPGSDDPLIHRGTIELNGVEVHDGEIEYSSSTLYDWRA